MKARSALLALQPKEMNFTLDIGGKPLSLYARELTGAEADKVAVNSLDESTGDVNTRNFWNYRIIACIYDQETKKPLFQLEDFEALTNIPSNVLNKLRTKVSEVNSDITKEDIETAKK